MAESINKATDIAKGKVAKSEKKEKLAKSLRLNLIRRKATMLKKQQLNKTDQ